MSTRTIEVHQDELEYTPEGLRTSGAGLPLTVGSHNIVRITRPQRVRFLQPGLDGFAFNSSFPSPGVLQLFLLPEFRSHLEASTEGAQPFVRVFGHTDATGSESANKQVSERRAQAMSALLTADANVFKDLARHEDWGLVEAQVMLRVLRCDPGPPDGDLGRMTSRALEVFQHQFNTGMFHRHLGTENPSPISVTKQLDRVTFDALLDAFVSALSPELDPSHIATVAGCSEFNHANDEPSKNRRACIAVYPSLPLHHDKAPCRTADHTVCPVQEGQQTSCFWYREHFIENNAAQATRHFDLRWLFIDDTRAILSALTSLEDGTAVQFRVYRSPEVTEVEDLTESMLEDALSDPITGTVLNGIAYCEWSFDDETAEHLQHDRWVVPIPYEQALNENIFALPPKARIPVFTVQGGGASAMSSPPLYDAHRAVYHEEDEFEEPRYMWLTDALGRVFHTLFGQRTTDTTLRALATSVQAAAIDLTTSAEPSEDHE